MSYRQTQAEAILRRNEAPSELASRLIVPLANNLVERPWGGLRMRDFKGLPDLPDQIDTTGLGLGEAFEIAAYDADDEARRHPSRVGFEDGSTLELSALLQKHAESLLGTDFVRAYGNSFPLLPKTLDIKELLSVQAHPAGNTEVYVIIAADPGATIRLGFSVDIDATELKRQLEAGLAEQRALLDHLGDDCDQYALQRALAPWFADRDAAAGVLAGARLPPRATDSTGAPMLERLKALYWEVLERMNAVPVEAGQVIYNATPRRIRERTGLPAAAEVHALGNPERREILALEIRRPGPTFRAWDNVRFPIRDVEVGTALGAMNLEPTRPKDFIVVLEPVLGREGAFVSVDCEFFRVEHLKPDRGRVVRVPAEAAHCLHVIEGDVAVRSSAARELGELGRGRSAIVPAGVGAYEVSSGRPAHVVRVSLPL